VLSWGHDGDPQVWDPATGSFTAVPAPSLLFCAGHDFLPDGRLLVAGGHITDGHGLPNTNVFNPATRSWQAAAAMAKGRWYPTNTTLPNGDVVTIAGTDESGANVLVPEVWNGTSWRALTTASLGLPYYPRTFVAPDGRIFYAGEQQQSRYLNVSGTGSWTNGPLRRFGTRDYGSAVMYAPGRILYVGGGDPPTNTAEIIDLNQPTPTWTYTGSMAFARRQMDATLLPTGDVLVTGGTSGGGFNNPAGAVHAAELWSPATGTWTTLASNAVTRIYHGTTLVLPDGRVLHTGSGDAGGAVDELNYELYSPPYLFMGARPTITGATPAVVGYGQTVFVQTPDGAAIAKVTFMRLSSVTHAFDEGARLVPLSFSQVSGGVSVTIPASRTTAPPGPYMLFLVNGTGVPSVARIMGLQ
jgi:galactose oxidase-like protein